jgi:hypothetical protein
MVRGQVFAVDIDQSKMNMIVDRVGLGSVGEGDPDTARLIVTKGYEGWPHIKPLDFAPEDELVNDETVCVSVAIPSRRRRCGTVDGIDGRQVYASYVADYGNSGAGVYDKYGRMVGVITRMVPCSNGQICGSIFDRRYRWYDQKAAD